MSFPANKKLTSLLAWLTQRPRGLTSHSSLAIIWWEVLSYIDNLNFA